MSHEKDSKTPREKNWDNAFNADGLRGKVTNAPSYAGALSFLRRKYSRDLDGMDVAVTGIPMDTATTNRPGSRFGSRFVAEFLCLFSANPKQCK